MTKYIPLTKGKRALVDDDDFDKIMSMGPWHLSDSGYAVKRGLYSGTKKTLRMHRVINETPPHLYTDHVNHNKLDNRKQNLRTVNHSENMRNKTEQGKGYWYQRQNRNWVVEINGKHRGVFNTPDEAEIFAERIRAGDDLPKPKRGRSNADMVCFKGHKLSQVGTYSYGRVRRCRECQALSSKEYYRRKHANN